MAAAERPSQRRTLAPATSGVTFSVPQAGGFPTQPSQRNSRVSRPSAYGRPGALNRRSRASVQSTAPSDAVVPLNVQLANLRASNQQLALENTLLEVALQRVAPHGAAGADAGEERAAAARAMAHKPRVSQAPAVRWTQELTLQEKGVLVNNETDILQVEVESVRVRGRKELNDLKGQIEAAEAEQDAMRRHMYEFKRDVLGGAAGERGGKVSAEKLLRFLELTAQQQEDECDKLRLKVSSLKAQIVTLEAQKAQKEEAGDELQPVDLEALRIEGANRAVKVDERNAELLRLKTSSTRTQRVLTDLKKELGDLSAQVAGLRAQMAERDTQTAAWGAECHKMEALTGTAGRKFHTMQRQRGGDDKPLSLDYIKLKAEITELEKKAADWERKVEIAEVDAARRRQTARISGAAAAGATFVGGGTYRSSGTRSVSPRAVPAHS